MNLKLIEYISKRLAPKEYRLELQNRLENLCALSGTPMSPGLHQWVTEKFGLEMTRVIEDYSTFTSPKLSPELLSVVDRIVPSNYQGDDVNLSFRQLFDVSCAPPDCLYLTIVNDSTGGCFSDPTWDINGFGVDFNAVSNSFGGYDVQDGMLINVNDTCNQVSFLYIGSSSPDPLIVNDPVFGITVKPFFAVGCSFGCVTYEPIKLENIYESLIFMNCIATNFIGYGGNLDFVNDLFGAEIILNNIFSKYYPGSNVSVTESLGFITLTFNNIWYDPIYLNYLYNQFFYNGGQIEYFSPLDC